MKILTKCAARQCQICLCNKKIMSRTLLNVSFIILGIIVFSSCSDKIYLAKINSYLNSSTADAKSKYMSAGYHSFFLKKEGAGDDKITSLKDFNNWDGQLNPDVEILSHSLKDKTWFVQFNEQNDFSKLIGFPGWKGAMEIAFDSEDLIVETIYFPDSTNPSHKKWLQPAVDWLRINFPNELNDVYSNGKLIKNETAAIKWKELLKKWKDRKGEE
jgi:hypothetical protein